MQQTASFNPSPAITPNTPYDDLPELMKPREVAAYRRSTEWSVYDQVRRGILPVVRFGRMIRIPKTAVNSPVK
jgi:excisionase family DNA binding protein